MAGKLFLCLAVALLVGGVRGIPIPPAPNIDAPQHAWPAEFSAVCDPRPPLAFSVLRAAATADHSPVYAQSLVLESQIGPCSDFQSCDAQTRPGTNAPASERLAPGSDAAPLWQPFGLFATFPYINNASSMIYYSYTDKVPTILTLPHFVHPAEGHERKQLVGHGGGHKDTFTHVRHPRTSCFRIRVEVLGFRV